MEQTKHPFCTGKNDSMYDVLAKYCGLGVRVDRMINFAFECNLFLASFVAAQRNMDYVRIHGLLASGTFIATTQA